MLSATRRVPPVDFEGRVRARDAETSWNAATQQTRVRGEKLRAEIVLLFDVRGPMTDDELWDFRERVRKSPGSTWALVSRQSLRTRRHELRLAGTIRERVNLDGSAVMRPSDMGNPSQVWTLA